MTKIYETDYSRLGSVEDIRCSINFIDPKTKSELDQSIRSLAISILNENKNKKRTMVIKMLNAKMFKLMKGGENERL